MMELVQNVAFYNMVVRVLVPVGVELEPGTTKAIAARHGQSVQLFQAQARPQR